MLALNSNSKLLSVVRGAVEPLTETLGFPSVQRRSITRAVDEAFSNTVRHSYGSRIDRRIALYFRRTHRRRDGVAQQGLEILLCDRGPPSIPRDGAVDHSTTFGPAGWDCTLFHEAMDTMECTQKGPTNRLRLVKYLPEPTKTDQGR